MFTCIACTKQTDDGGEEGAARGSGTPNTKEAVKSLTAQVPNQSLSLFSLSSVTLSVFLSLSISFCLWMCVVCLLHQFTYTAFAFSSFFFL